MDTPAKQKLVYILHELAVGGVEVALLSALPALHAHFNLRIYVLGRATPAMLNSLPAEIRRRITCYPYPSWLTICCLPAALFAICRFRPAILISSLWRSALLASLCKRCCPGIRYFLFLHSSIYFHRPDRFFLQSAIKNADVILADSEASKTLAARTARPATPIVVVSMLTQPSPSEINVPDFNSSPKRFFFTGRLHPVKNLPLAVSAIAWLRGQGVDAVFDIYGRDDGDLPAVRQRIRQTGMDPFVRIMGEIQPAQKMELHRQYHFYMQLSKDEGMAMSVAEAMQHGAVCFVTPVGEIPAYAAHQVSAIFMQTANPDAWQESLQQLLNTVSNPANCQQLSYTAHQTFRNVPVYQEALIHVIYEYGLKTR